MKKYVAPQIDTDKLNIEDDLTASGGEAGIDSHGYVEGFF